jgi:hypothetical protein
MAAISIPIITDFDGKGLDRAVREFQKLETAGQKAQFAIGKAAVPAAAALGVLVGVASDAVGAFMEDEKSASALAKTLENVTGANDKVVKSTEDWITKTSLAISVADDQLRPALDKLVRGTGDVAEAQNLLTLALDISAGTGKDLGSVADALSKAFNGTLGPLKKLDPALTALIEDGATTEEVFKALSDTFGGQAATAADTTAGKMENIKIRMDEMKESIGEAVLPIVDDLMPAFTSISDWASKNTGLIVAIGTAIAGIAAAVLLTNGALAVYNALTALTAAANAVLATSFTVLWVATGVGIILAIIAALVVLEMKFGFLSDAVEGVKIMAEFMWNIVKEGFNWVVNNWPLLLAVLAGPFGMAIAFVIKFKDQIFDIIKSIIGFMVSAFSTIAETILAPFKAVFNGIAGLWNSTVGALGFTVPSWVPLGLGGKTFEVPDIPVLGDGGIVTGPTLALIGERGPEAVIPLNRAGGGMGGNTINVNVTSANPQEVVRALQKYVRLNGQVPINTRGM